MTLPFGPPVLPMLAKRAEALPVGEGWLFEPKWDGFRALVFRDGDEVFLQSRDGKPLARYFPELIATLRAGLPSGCVLDGEIVIARNGVLDFEALQLRLHPAASRAKLLSEQLPAAIVFFDLLCLDDVDLRERPFAERRDRLEDVRGALSPPLHLTPVTADPVVADDWFTRFEGAGLDGVMAKGLAGPYEPNKRTMLKVKHARECDCIVAGFRWHKDAAGTAVGSLLLGLLDESGALQHVGVAASFTDFRRQELVGFLAPWREHALENHPWREWADPALWADPSGQRRPGAGNRWNVGKDMSWVPLRPELVVEVGYDHMQGSRFRHTAQFRRWRPDKPASGCTYAQLEVVPPAEIAAMFGGSR